MALTQTQVSQLYVATFGRASEGEGNEYWQTAGGDTMASTAEAMLASPAGMDYFGDTLNDNQAFIEFIYENTLGKTYAQDPEGVDFWVSQLESGRTKGEVIADLVYAASTAPAADEDAQRAQDQFNNKVAVSDYCAENIEDYSGQMATFSGFIDDVDESAASVTAAQSAIDTAVPGSLSVNFKAEEAAGADVMRITGNQDVRIDLTANDNQVEGIDLDNDGVIEHNGVENVDPTTQDDGQDFEIVDAYTRNPANYTDTGSNFFGDIAFDGTGFAGDGVNTDGNIFLGGLGADTALGGIGNDFMAGGGVNNERYTQEYDAENGTWIWTDSITGETFAANPAGMDSLSGGRNADFFFAELSLLDNVDGDALTIDGGSTTDDAAVDGDTAQDSDWLLIEASDDDEPVTIDLSDFVAGGAANDEEDQGVSTRSGVTITMQEIENVDASGNLYGFLDDINTTIGGKAGQLHDEGENVGLGSSAQLRINGSEQTNIIIGGFDNDVIDGEAGNDLLFGGRMDYLNNPNLTGIVNDGIDEIFGGAGDDDIVFEADGGMVEGDNQENVDSADSSDTLWLTAQALGTQTVSQLTTDDTLRFDLGAGRDAGLDTFSGYGGADENYTDGDMTADQTNYAAGVDRVQVQDIENVIATGLGAVDYLAAGTNDPDLTFNNQQNIQGYEGNLTLRGIDGGAVVGDNTLYANTGDDILEGRKGDDQLSGGLGNDDFIFQLQDGGDGLDVIHRQADADGNNIWDFELDADGNTVDADEDGEADRAFTQDFGDNGEAVTSNSSLTLTLTDTAAPANELQNIPVSGVVFTLNGTQYTVQSDEMGAADTYAAFVTALDAALDADAALAGLDAVQNADNTITITDPAGGTFAAVGYTWVDNIAPASGDISWDMAVGGPTVEQSRDRLIFAAYEDRADGELVDDDGFVNQTGDAVTLGADGYAEDLVVRFDADGNGTTVLAEDQQWDLTFANLADEDTLSISVNGTSYSLQMGVAADGTAIGETQAQFLQRMVDMINAGSDQDTLAGTLDATLVGNTIQLTQGNYYTGQVVFMDEPVVTLGNASGGEAASVEIAQPGTDSEITLFEYDGRNNGLNAENALFLGGSGMNEGVVTNPENSRSVLATATNDGGALNGSDALVLDTMDDADTLATDFSLHGDDLLLTGIGDDQVTAGTGDDRIFGSIGTDTVDGGKDLYVVETLVNGSVVESVETLNAYDAAQRLAAADVVGINLLEEDATAGARDGFVDHLIFSQSDFTNARFTITVSDDLDQMEGGEGTVGVDEGQDGSIDHVTTFTEMEAIRTLAGDGTHAGQGQDTLDVSALSNAVAATDAGDADAAVIYNMTSAAGFIEINADLDGDGEIDADGAAAGDENNTFLAVDGVEHLIGGNANDQLNIDEAEVNKDNTFNAGNEVVTDADQVGDSIVYDHSDMDNSGVADAGEGAAILAMRPSLELVVESGNETDLVNLTGGTIIGSDVTTDTLVDVETVDVEAAATSTTLDDTLDVTNVNDAVIDFVNSEVRANGDLVNNLGDELIRIAGMDEFEIVEADGDDTVIIADDMGNTALGNSRASDTDSDIVFDSFLNYDILDDKTDAAPGRMTVSALRLQADDGLAYPAGDDRADMGDIPEVENYGLFTFNLGQDTDTVDYSDETGLIAAVVDFDANTQAVVNNVLVSDNNNTDFTDDGGGDNRVDVITGAENFVASQGNSILDLTQAETALKIRFNADDGATSTVAELDRDVFRVQLSELQTTNPFASINFLEYFDAGDNADVAQATAAWTQVEGGDLNEMIELTDHETAADHTFNLRGGDNEVNYNELTRSINTTINVTDYDAAAVNPAATGIITVTNTFTDGNLVAIGGTDTVTSYTANNAISAGSLRIEASQDAEDSVTFAAGLEKLFILGEVVDGSDQITVKLGEGDAQNTMELTGYELLLDAASDDVYEIDDLDRVFNNLTLTDNGVNDRDTLAIDNDGVAFDNGTDAPVLDTIILDHIENANGFNFDFDVLDITAVTNVDTTIIGDAADAERQDIVIGDYDAIDNGAGAGIQNFDRLILTDASVGTGFDLDIDAGEFQTDADATIFEFDGAQVDFSRITDDRGPITVTVTDDAAAGATVIGSLANDVITGGAGADTLQGGGGNDTLDGGFVPEVIEVHTYTLSSTAAGLGLGAGQTMTINGVTVTEGAVFQGVAVAEDDADAMGAAFVRQWEADPTAFTVDNASAAPDTITDVTYDALTNELQFTFATGNDPADNVLGAGAGTAAADISAETVTAWVAQGESSDTYVFEATAAANGVDTINSFNSTGVATDDVLDFTAFLGGAAGFNAGPFTTASAGNVNVDGDVSLWDANGTALTAATLAAEFAGGGTAFSAVADDTAVIYEVDSSVAGEDARIWFVSDADGDGAITADEVAVVGVVTEGGDVNIAAGNFA
jgi:hypothetical protein